MNARVVELWRYPVKSMLGEQLDEARIDERGVAGDRAFALIDTETGKVCSAKRYDLWGSLFEFSATLQGSGTAQVRFPNGTTRTTDDPRISDELSRVLGRPVALASSAPPQPQIEEIWDESKGEQKYGPTVGRADGQEVIEFGGALAVPGGGFFDAAAVHLITTNTLEELTRREPGSEFAVRRFRPNVVVEVTGEQGFVENDWTTVRIGDVELRTLMPVPRCVMTTLPQQELARDSNVLRATARHNMVDTKVLGIMPCAGLYAMVAGGGTIRVGDAVTVD